MRIGQYLRDRYVFITMQMFALMLICFFLEVFKLNRYAIFFVAIVLVVANMIVLFEDFFKKRSFYNETRQSLENLDKKYLLSELIDEPNFFEGKVFHEIMKSTHKSMNDHIATYKIASEEYREYIETWIHEIKTPIAASKLIIDNNRNEITQSLSDELYKIDTFVEQALFYSRSNSVEKDYIIQEILLSDAVKSAIKKHSKYLIESGVRIELTSLEHQVFIDVKWLDFILGQLISNAIKYKSKKPKLSMHARKLENSVILTIEDNGIGICEKDINRVFEKGFTGENGRRYAKSTGIGLYLCKKLCGKMGLGIGITSNVGEGTKIEIVFPKSKMAILEP